MPKKKTTYSKMNKSGQQDITIKQDSIDENYQLGKALGDSAETKETQNSLP